MIVLKSVLGGIAATVIMWLAVIGTAMWRLEAARRQQGITGLGAVAGGWSYLLRLPLVIVLLTASFGVGLYITARWISN
jgi:hypothetical protein